MATESNAPKTWWGTFKRWVEAGKVVQTSLAIVIAASGVAYAPPNVNVSTAVAKR